MTVKKTIYPAGSVNKRHGMTYYFGIDLGGTSIKVGLVNNDGEPICLYTIPTRGERGPEEAIVRINSIIERVLADTLIDRSSIAGIGLATPGTMNIPKGMLLSPSNLPSWKNFPIRDRLRDVCGFPVTFVHDASAAAYGEYWHGAAQGEEGVITITLGTGIGCGIVLRGEVWDGIHCHGGECGHIIIDMSPTARWCNCGQQGHLEAYASATGVVKRTLEMVHAGLNTSLSQRIYSIEQQLEIPKILFEEASGGDALSLRIIDDTAFYLALGLVSIVNTVDPSCILIGGAMTFGGKDTELGRNFLQTIDRQFRQRTFSYLAERIRIDYAQLGSDAGFIGAAGLAKHENETKTVPEQSLSSIKRVSAKPTKPTKQTKHRKPKSGKKAQ